MNYLLTSYLEAGAALVRRKQENHWRRGHSHLVVELRQSKESRRRVQQGWEGGGGGEGTVVLSGIRHLEGYCLPAMGHQMPKTQESEKQGVVRLLHKCC